MLNILNVANSIVTCIVKNIHNIIYIYIYICMYMDLFNYHASKCVASSLSSYL